LIISAAIGLQSRPIRALQLVTLLSLSESVPTLGTVVAACPKPQSGHHYEQARQRRLEDP